MRLSSLTPKFLLLLLSLPEFSSAASSILGIDLGQEYFKASLVKPGIPLEIVLTKDSRRKEASAIAFKPSRLPSANGAYSFPDRIYGVDAANLAARLPQESYPNLKQLLGKHMFDDTVTEYSARYPALELLPGDGRPTTTFQSASSPPGESGNQHFTVEELLAMQLKNIQRNALALAAEKGKPGAIEDVVFSIPAYFTAEEKYSLQLAAELVGLKVMAMISDGVAIGINYATGREFKPDDKPETNIIYDMGAGSTTATVIKFAGKTVKDVGRYKKNITEVAVLGVGWDQTLGGDLFNKKLSEHLLNDFLESPKAKKIGEGQEGGAKAKDLVKRNGRSAAKLWREASKVRHVLSANSEAHASIESLYEDIDYKSKKITRAQFEEYLEEYSDRVTKPLHQALESAGLTLDNIDSIIFHGGGVRVPWVAKLLEGLVGENKISRTVNSDEAAVMGATFRGAALSNSFRVKEIAVHDINPYAVSVSYRQEGSQKEITQTIFPPTTPLNTEKIFPLKRTADFSFHFSQSIPSPVSGRKPQIELINQVITKNLTATAEKLLKDHGCTAEHVRTEFQLRLREKDGLPEVMNAWAGCDVEYEDVPETKEDKKKNGKKGKDEKGEGVLDGVKDFLGLKKKKDAGANDSSSSSSSETTSASAEETPKVNLKNQEGEQTNLNGKAAEKKYITKFEKIPLELEIKKSGFPAVSPEAKKALINKILGFDQHDAARLARDAAFNDLESTVYKLREFLSDDTFTAASPSDVITSLTNLVEETSSWLYDSEGGDIALGDAIKSKLKALVDLAEPIKNRMEEHKKRPEQVRLVKEALEQTKQLALLMEETVKAEESNKEQKRKAQEEAAAAASASESAKPDGFEGLEDEDASAKPETPEEPVVDIDAPPTYSAEDIDSLNKLIISVTTFLDEKIAEQEKLPLDVDPVVTVKQLEEKIQQCNRLVMEIMTKQIREQEEKERKEKIEKARKEKEKKKKEKEEKERKKKEKEEEKEKEKAEKKEGEAEGKKDRERDEL